MNITIREVQTGAQLNAFIRFPYTLYKGDPYYVPPLSFDEKATLQKDKNPAFDYCEARYWLAYKGKRVVGRIAAILNTWLPPALATVAAEADMAVSVGDPDA